MVVKKRDKEVCPVCGSSECVEVPELPESLCPKCRCNDVLGVVRERSGELAVIDWRCRRCGHLWSSCRVLPEGFGVKSVLWSVFEK